MNIQSFLDNLIFLSLLLVTIFYWAGTVYSKSNFLERIGFYGHCFVNFTIFVLLGSRWMNFGYFPLSNLYESLMFLAWCITLISIIIQQRSNLPLIGSISSPISLFVSGFASLSLPENMQTPSPLVPALKSNWLMMHVTVMLLSYASLIVGSLLGVFFLILYYGKKGSINLQGSSFGASISNSAQSINNFSNTKFIPEALYRTTEIYISLGLKEEAYNTASVLGHNYPKSQWYKLSYNLVNDNPKSKSYFKKFNFFNNE